MNQQFSHNNYVCRSKWFSFFGKEFYFDDPSGNVVFYAHMKAFKLKEDIRLYSDASKSTEMLTIKARQILDFSACYDVVDTVSGQKVGAFKRKGFHSMLKDKWIILDVSDREIGEIAEDSWVMALLRRYLMNLIPQRFSAVVEGAAVCEFRQNFNPFLLKIAVDFSKDTGQKLDRRLGIAAVLLLAAIEGRQQ